MKELKYKKVLREFLAARFFLIDACKYKPLISKQLPV
jgi:hypothetical protein